MGIFRKFIKKIIFCCLFVNVNICLSQDNISLFAVDQTMWSIGVFSDNPIVPDYIYFLKIDGQVFIDDTLYYKIKKSQNFSVISEDWDLSCYARVDADSILYLRTIDNIEKKIFNYKLEYGESEGCWLYDYFAEEFLAVNLTIQEVVYIVNSTYTYKKWTVVNELGDVFPYTTWIENIGCVEGILKANRDINPITGRTDVVMCAWLDDSQIYANDNYENCGLVEKNDISNEVFTFYPNPFNDIIKFYSSENENIESISLYDMSGRLVYFQNNPQGDASLELNCSFLSNGCYIAYLQSGELKKRTYIKISKN